MAYLRTAAQAWAFEAQVPLTVGEPEFGYRFRYSIFEWIPGSNALRSPLTVESARRLGAALAVVHQSAPIDAPEHPHVQVPLTWQSQAVYHLIGRVEARLSPGGRALDGHAAREAWDAGLDFPHSRDQTWVHGALDPRVILSDGGRFVGLSHWRELSRADPALDLTLAATALNSVGLTAMLDAYGPVAQPSTSLRIRAGVVARALNFVLAPNPALARLGWSRLSEHGCLEVAGQ
jgi:aminoglycoside phosphotransferase (APT) family kinase protein